MQSVRGLVSVEGHASPGKRAVNLGMHRTIRKRACSRNKFVHGPGLRICFPAPPGAPGQFTHLQYPVFPG